MKEKEEWKDIKGYEGSYQVSSLGRVKSYPKKTKSIGSAGYEYYIIRKERILAITKDTHGYVQCPLSKDKIQKHFLMHRLVAQEFIPNPENKRCVNHINGIKDDNRVDNLEWATHSENSKHSFKIGLQCNKGENHPRCKLKDSDILLIRELYYVNKISSYKIFKNHYNHISYTNIKDIIAKRTWTHV